MATQTRTIAPTPLATFVRERLSELDINQSDFCRLSMFDQGLLSKIQNSVVTSLSLESVLKLAVGLSVAPKKIFSLLDRMDMHDLVIKSYAGEFSELVGDRLSSEKPDVAAEAQRVLTEAAVKPLNDAGKPRRRRWQGEPLTDPAGNSHNGSINSMNGSFGGSLNGMESGT
jgi:transcriptional regulator with XRE-family HTH domain